jgi:PDZ domain-containing protein
MARRTQTLMAASMLALVLAVVGLWLPVPFVTLAPGPVTDTLGTTVDGASLIEIKGEETFPTDGKLELTTVEETPELNLLGALRDWLDSDRAVVPRELVQPPGTSQEELRQENTQAMLDSQDMATVAALSELGISPSGTTVRVVEVPDDSPAAGKLEPSDVLRAVNGTPVTSQDQLRSEIAKVRPGEPVTVTFERGGTPAQDVSIMTRAAPDEPDRPIIGVTTSAEPIYPFTVEIRLSDVGGPSAGLMFALGIVDLLNRESLTHGRTVAGTGTIDASGVVGPIGGIQQKILGAEASGATIFLVPAANCIDAREAGARDLALVRVESLSGAIDALDSLAADPDAHVPTC